MTANELADYLQNKAKFKLQPLLQEAATMLRQQQAEIEHLKGLIVLLKMQVNGLKKASEK